MATLEAHKVILHLTRSAIKSYNKQQSHKTPVQLVRRAESVLVQVMDVNKHGRHDGFKKVGDSSLNKNNSTSQHFLHAGGCSNVPFFCSGGFE